MPEVPIYDVSRFITHNVDSDCELIVRTNNGRRFYYHIEPSIFQRSPQVLEKYFKCLNVLRNGEIDDDDDIEMFEDEACDWLVQPLEPVIAKLAPLSAGSNPPPNTRPTMEQYMFPVSFSCSLTAIDEELCAQQTEEEVRHESPWVEMSPDFIAALDQWARSYHPSEIQICYMADHEFLIREPRQVVVSDGRGGDLSCFFKPFAAMRGMLGEPEPVERELGVFEKIAKAGIPHPPVAWICRLVGVVREGYNLAGMLLTWIAADAPLAYMDLEHQPKQRKAQWAEQITASVEELHRNGIVWGDAKTENVLVDKDGNAWLVDFGGGYTEGWVDKEKASTFEGDKQGLRKILEALA